jgi:outer membrane biosynthesis protein TonB
MSDGSVEVQVAMPLKGALLDTLVPDNYGRPSGVQPPSKPAPIPQRPEEIKKPQPPSMPTEQPKPEPPKPVIPAPVVPEKRPEPVKPSLPPATTPEKRPDQPAQPEPSKPGTSPEGPTVVFKGGTATGLVIDGRGLGLRPALLPRIVDAHGQEIYVGQVVTRTNAVEQGVAGYARDVNAAANNFRVTDNPAVLKGLRASGSTKTDIVLGQADAQTLRQLGGKGDFLQYCRVIIVY